jgi:ubiquinone/menaquinone biosynthesis C-methylase UbiE
MRTQESMAGPASLESLVETGQLELESLHPGGLALTRELAELCHVREGTRVLDVACGTGETACFLAAQLGARVHGIDRSEAMVARARAKAEKQGVDAVFAAADAARLPFGDAEFDAAICECTLCFLDKKRVIGEMARVVRSGGYVGMHDLCWKQNAPDALKRTLAHTEGEAPESLEGWRRLFSDAGLAELKVLDKSGLMASWMRETRRRLGITGQLSLMLQVLRQWGPRGVWRILQSERVFGDDRLGYATVVGSKPLRSRGEAIHSNAISSRGSTNATTP